MNSIKGITNEWKMLEQCVLHFNSKSVTKELNDLITDRTLNWSEMFHQALRHNLLPLVAYIIINKGLFENVPNEFREILFSSYLINKLVFHINYGEVSRIIDSFEKESISYVITKGYTFDSTIYRGLNIRKTNDIDFMILPRDKTRTFEILRSIGYKPGYFDFESSEIIDMPEASMKMYSMINEFAPEFAIKVADPIIQHICVDITCSLTWFNSQYKIDLSDALNSRIMIDVPGHVGKQMPCFSLEYQIVYTMLHLFKEAWVEMYGIKDGNDVSLSKFMDVYWLFKDNETLIDRSKLLSIINNGGIEKPFVWVLKHTDRIFNSNFCEFLGYEETVSESWLSSWQTKSYITKYWKGSMQERLQAKDRSILFLK